jgi:hypothetical protein
MASEEVMESVRQHVPDDVILTILDNIVSAVIDAPNTERPKKHALVIQNKLEEKPASKRAKISVAKVSNVPVRPEPSSPPPVWANTRQQLCDALPYYKSHHGAIYKHKGAKGILVDKEVTMRDVLDHEIIITTL